MKQSTKHKAQRQISKFLLLFVLALTLSNCQVEEEALKKESPIQTVNVNEAISFLKQNPVSKESKLSKTAALLPNLTNITQEKIINSDQLLTVIPLLTNKEQEYSRILMLKVQNELKSVVFSMYPDKDSLSKGFSGKIMITTLNGDFVNGFRVKNGTLISQFVKSTKVAKNNVYNKSDAPIELNEVIIINSYHNTTNFEIDYFFWHSYNYPISVSTSGGSGSNPNDNFIWNSGGSGGGGITYQEIQDQIISTDPNAYNIDFINDQNGIIASTSINLLPWTGVEISVNQNAGVKYTVQNVTSNAFGLTLGYSWSQNTYSQNTNGNTTTININGSLNCNMFAQGIGNVFSYNINIMIQINNTNGHIISGTRLP